MNLIQGVIRTHPKSKLIWWTPETSAASKILLFDEMQKKKKKDTDLKDSFCIIIFWQKNWKKKRLFFWMVLSLFSDKVWRKATLQSIASYFYLGLKCSITTLCDK